MNISTIRKAYRKMYVDLSQDTADLVSTGRKSLVLTKASLSILIFRSLDILLTWLNNNNSSISFFHAYIESKHSQSKLHWKRGFGKYSRLSRLINGILGKRSNLDDVFRHLLAISELRKRRGNSDVDNGSWDCFRGHKQKASPQKYYISFWEKKL